MKTITFSRRQVALMLRIIMIGEPTQRLTKATHTAAADLRRIAAQRMAPTAAVLAHLDLKGNGKGGYIWQFE